MGNTLARRSRMPSALFDHFGLGMNGDRILGSLLDMDRSLESVLEAGPAVDIQETADSLVLRADLPGFRTDDVDIQLEGRTLAITGERKLEYDKEDAEGEGTKMHVRERRWGRFARSFVLPRTVDAEGIEATFQDGVLSVRMPKPPEARGRKIPIRSGATEGSPS